MLANVRKDHSILLYITVCSTLVAGPFPYPRHGKALGTRLIVCCLEVLHLRPFTFLLTVECVP